MIHTERLTLRAPRMDDAPAIFDSYARDPQVTRYLVWTPHRSVAETQEYLRGVTNEAQTQCYAIQTGPSRSGATTPCAA